MATTFPTELDRKARVWVQSNYETAVDFGCWELHHYWEFIEEFYIGGRAEFVAKYSYRETVECDRHGGPWGGDETCARCTDEDGSVRPLPH